MKTILISVLFLLLSHLYASCNSYGGSNWNTTNCYNNGYRESWNTNRYGSITTTNYSNNKGTRGTSNQFNYGNGDYQRTYRNNQGYSSTTTKIGNCYYFNDNQGNRRSKCY